MLFKIYHRFFSILPTLLLSTSALAAPQTITIGTGDLTGVYYPAGGAICRIINNTRAEHGIRCAVESTQGSTHNIDALYARELDLAIVQGDRLFHAVQGTDTYQESGPHQQLRTLLILHSEAFTLVARADSRIKSFSDLKNKRINIGSSGSGHRKTMDLLMQIQDWQYSDFALTTELPASEMAQALCDGKIDAFVYMVGHPNTLVKEATSYCDSRIIPLPDALLQTISQQYPYYQPTVIEGGLYNGSPNDIPTFKVNAILTSNTKLADDTAYQIVKNISTHLSELRSLHPALKPLTQKSIRPVKPNLAPVHEGTQKWLNETKD